MKKIIACTGLALSFMMLAGCPASEQERAVQNQFNLKNPDRIGVLEDGRTVLRATIGNDRLYIIDNATVVSSQQVGKQRHMITTVSPSVDDIEKIARLKADRAALEQAQEKLNRDIANREELLKLDGAK